MSYNKNDITTIATKLGRLVKGGVVGYYAGGKTSEVMRNAIPENIVGVVERHKKVQLAASLAQSFVPGAGVAASAAEVASLWKMYYDINNVLGIKVSENAGKSLTSAILTNLGSFAAKGVATAVSEGAKFIPFVGWIASAGISTATSTAIVYGAAFMYLKALVTMYEVGGKFDINRLNSIINDDEFIGDNLSDETMNTMNDNKSWSEIYNDVKMLVEEGLHNYSIDIERDTNLSDLGMSRTQKEGLKRDLEGYFSISIPEGYLNNKTVEEIADAIYGLNNPDDVDEEDDDVEGEDVDVADEEYEDDDFERCFDDFAKSRSAHILSRIDKLIADCVDKEEKVNLNLLAAVACLDNFISVYYEHCTMQEYRLELLHKGIDYIEQAMGLGDYSEEMQIIWSCLQAHNDFWVTHNFSSNYYNKRKIVFDSERLSCRFFSAKYIDALFQDTYSSILEYCTPNGLEIAVKEECVVCNENDCTDKTVVENNLSSLSAEEEEYLNEYKEMLADGEISDRDRRYLNKIMNANGISEARAKELEAMASSPSLTDEEQEYLKEYREIISEGPISPRDQRFLDKLKKTNGISDARAKELEAMA